MKSKNRHKWKHEKLFSSCIYCDIRKTLISENQPQIDGSNKKIFRIEYFSNDGQILKSTGCKFSKQFKLTF
jgi:hypothetical protein